MAKSLSLLIIDDDPTLRDLYQQRFAKAGFEVMLATNGDEGVEMALTHKPDVIITDLRMPAKGGLGVLEVLKTMPETKAIPMVVLTAYPSDEYKAMADRAGAALFLSKSEQLPHDLVEQVQALIK